MNPKNPHAVALGKKGGQVTGKCKARSRAHCQAAALAMHALRRAKLAAKKTPTP